MKTLWSIVEGRLTVNHPYAMSLMRLALAAPLGRSCTRGLSTSSRRSAASAVLDTLQTTQAQKTSLATRIADYTLPDTRTTELSVQNSARRTSFLKQMHRKWTAGDVYAPHDLSGAEQKKWKTGRKTPQSDAFDRLGIDPINEYKVRHACCHSRCCPVLIDHAELHPHVRVHDRDGPHQALQGHGSAPQEPAQDCKGHTASHWPWSDAQRAPTSTGTKEELASKISVGQQERVRLSGTLIACVNTIALSFLPRLHLITPHPFPDKSTEALATATGTTGQLRYQTRSRQRIQPHLDSNNAHTCHFL
jgi:hypothetical protein